MEIVVANDTPKYFVKFLPYNQRTISSLINKQIWFSKVHQLNDFTELNVIGSTSDFHEELGELMHKYLEDLSFKAEILEYYPKQGYCRDFTTKFISDLKKQNNLAFIKNDGYVQVILEWIAYYLVGIFSLSEIDVFKDASAMIMFAHYASNLTGIACIYEVHPKHESHLKKILFPELVLDRKDDTPIDYDDERLCISRCDTALFHERVVEWCAGNYSQVDNFTRKAKQWDYEKEWRLFSTPGIKDASEAGVKLKCILYTPRFNSTEIETLKKINNHFYESNLLLAELIPSFTKYRFDVIRPDSRGSKTSPAFEWICEALKLKA